MSAPETRRIGRPPRVSAAAILDAAALMPAEEMTLTSVAATLGISVKTVYYYFSNRSALLAALSARALAELHPPTYADCTGWEDALRRTARWAFATLREQPPYALQDAGSVATGLSHVLVPCLEVLRQDGFSDERAVEVLVLVSNFAVGMAVSAQNTDRVGGASPENLDAWVRTVDESDVATRLTFTISSRSVDAWFESALDLAVAGAAEARRSQG